MTIAAGLHRLEVQRGAIGLIQGGLLLLLVRAANTGFWPDKLNLFHAPLLLTLLFVPIAALSALGKLSSRQLALWLGVVAMLVFALGVYDVYRRIGAPRDWNDFAWFFQLKRKGALLPPSADLTAFLLLGLFIAQSLVLAGAADRRWFARYGTYFDVSWVLGIQIALSLFFTGLFWVALDLGAGLFEMIGVDFFDKMFKRDWFILPVTAAAFSLGLHLSDARADWVRGIRRLVLILLSWLLPLLALFTIGFLATLPVMGVEALWKTRHGASLVLTTACCLIGLLNAAYQQGESPPPLALRWTGRAAALTLVPLVALGFWAIWLRVEQYGLTSERVVAIAATVVIACYAVGYLIAAVLTGPWLRILSHANVVTAFIVLAVIVALVTPLADPARLLVANQMARLDSGRTPAEKFDLKALRFDGERYGLAALAGLAEGSNRPDFLRKQAKMILTMQQRYDHLPIGAEDRAANVTVYPVGKTLDPGFLATDWARKGDDDYWYVPDCLTAPAEKCNAYLVNLDGAGADEVVIPAGNDAWVFQQKAGGTWARVGSLKARMPCDQVESALKQGHFEIVPPQTSAWQDIAIGDGRLTMEPVQPRPSSRCWE